jgi:hypothetical protein
MNMIRHQDIGVYRRLVVCGGFFSNHASIANNPVRRKNKARDYYPDV